MNPPTQISRVRNLRILVVAPRGRDAELMCDLLTRLEIDCEKCETLESAIDNDLLQVGALVFAEEALTPEIIQRLSDRIHHQPTWSDFPLIILTTAGQVTGSSIRRNTVREPLGNVLLLERPIRPETLISTVQNALRARRRQYQMRDQLEQLDSTQQALMQSEKLAVTGRLAASIAHEINNPLEAVTNLLYLARTSPAVADREYYLLEAEKELARVSQITNQTLMFNRQVSGPSATDVAGVLNSVLSLYQGRLRNSNVVIERDFEEIPLLIASGGELRQLFANLIGNALDAMRGGGKLTLRLRKTRNGSGNHKGIRVLIADSGYGIPPAIKSRVFEPFVSTKGNTGTGLGLWLGLEIVNKHGGSIRLRSRTTAPTGTVISISLPLVKSAADKVAV